MQAVSIAYSAHPILSAARKSMLRAAFAVVFSFAEEIFRKNQKNILMIYVYGTFYDAIFLDNGINKC